MVNTHKKLSNLATKRIRVKVYIHVYIKCSVNIHAYIWCSRHIHAYTRCSIHVRTYIRCSINNHAYVKYSVTNHAHKRSNTLNHGLGVTQPQYAYQVLLFGQYKMCYISTRTARQKPLIESSESSRRNLACERNSRHITKLAWRWPMGLGGGGEPQHDSDWLEMIWGD